MPVLEIQFRHHHFHDHLNKDVGLGEFEKNPDCSHQCVLYTATVHCAQSCSQMLLLYPLTVFN